MCPPKGHVIIQNLLLRGVSAVVLMSIVVSALAVLRLVFKGWIKPLAIKISHSASGEAPRKIGMGLEPKTAPLCMGWSGFAQATRLGITQAEALTGGDIKGCEEGRKPGGRRGVSPEGGEKTKNRG